MLGKDEAQGRNALRKSRSGSRGREGLGEEDRESLFFTGWFKSVHLASWAVNRGPRCFLEPDFNAATQGKRFLSQEVGGGGPLYSSPFLYAPP